MPAGPTHRLLAQSVKLIADTPDGHCLVRFSDGSSGNVPRDGMVSLAGVLRDQAMIGIELLSRAGDYVTTVSAPPFQIPVEVIQWGTRSFVLRPNGEYREGIVWFCSDE